MNFSVEKNQIISILHNFITIVAARSPYQYLTSYMLEADKEKGTLKIMVTDLELSVISTIKTNIMESGKVVVPAKSFTDIISSLPDKIIKFIKSENTLDIYCENAEFKIYVFDETQFPLVLEKNLENLFEMNIDIFCKMVKNTSFVVPNRVDNQANNGVLWKISNNYQLMTATDRNRLAKIDYTHSVNLENEIEKILSVKVLNFVERIKNDENNLLGIALSDNRIIFSYENYKVISATIEESFPDMTSLFAKEKNNYFIVNCDKLKTVVKRIALLSSNVDYQLYFDFIDGKLIVSSKDSESGKSKEILDLEEISFNEPLRFSYNFRFLLSILNNIETDNLKASFSDTATATLFENCFENEKLYAIKFLLMPLRG